MERDETNVGLLIGGLKEGERGKGREGEGGKTYLDVHQNVIKRPSSHGVSTLRGVLAVEPKDGIPQVKVGQDVGVAAGEGLGKLDLAAHGQGEVRGNGESRRKPTKLLLVLLRKEEEEER